MSRGKKTTKTQTTTARKTASSKKDQVAKEAFDYQQTWLVNMYCEIELKRLEVEAFKMLEYSLDSYRRDSKDPLYKALIALKNAKEAELGQTYERNSHVLGQPFDVVKANDEAASKYLEQIKQISDRAYYLPALSNPAGWLAYSSTPLGRLVREKVGSTDEVEDFEFDSKIYQAVDTAEKYIEYTAARMQAFSYAMFSNNRSSKDYDDEAYRLVHQHLWSDHDTAWKNLLLFASLLDDEEMRKSLTAKAVKHYLDDERGNRNFSSYLSPRGTHESFRDDDDFKTEIKAAIENLEQ